MNKKNIFDMLENAEDELMDDFTDMSPDISDDQLEKLLAVSERNYRMKKKEIERTRKVNNKEYGNTVSGVERVRRPVWLTPLMTAASVVLIAGVVISSVALLKNNRNNIVGGGDDTNIGNYQTQPNLSAPWGTEITAATGAGSAADTTVSEKTTFTTTAAVTEIAEEQTSDAEDMSVDPQLGAIALEMCKKDEEMLPLLYGCANIDQDDYIEVAVYDPSRRQDTTENRRYARVNDSHFSTWDDMVRYFRTLYTADCERIQNFTDATTREDAVWDDVKIGDFIEVKKAHVYIEYGGKLYRVSEIPKGFLFSTFDENDPVIITERTDTSFTAFIPRWDSTVALDPDFPKTIDTTSCNELRFILDPEYNDWRIDNIVYHDQGVYKKLFDKLNS